MKLSELVTGRTYRAKVAGLRLVVVLEAVRKNGTKTLFDVRDTKSGMRSTLMGVGAFEEEVKTINPGDMVTVRGNVYRVESVRGDVVKCVNGPTVTRAFCHPIPAKVEPPPALPPVVPARAVTTPPLAPRPSGAAKVPPSTPPVARIDTEIAPATEYLPAYPAPEHWTATKRREEREAAEGEKGLPPPAAAHAERDGGARSVANGATRGSTSPSPDVVRWVGERRDAAVAREASALAGLNTALAAERAEAPLGSNTRSKVPHVIATALAGTGKTTTLVQGMRGVLGMDPKQLVTNKGTRTIDPMPQQLAIWDAMRRGGRPRTVCFAAYNHSIATELKTRVPAGSKASTINGLGFGAVHKAFKLKEGDDAVNPYRVGSIIGELVGEHPKGLREREPTFYAAVEQLADLVRQNLTDLSRDPEGELDMLAGHYEVPLSDDRGDHSSRVYELVPRVVERLKDVNKDKCVDFTDQVWLPVVLGLPVFEYDMLLVDEWQDLNRAQHALVMKAGRRLVCCGDPNQAIYGFAGADVRSMERGKEALDGRGGVVELPLTVTRRCGKRIVADVKSLVPAFEAHESNCEGNIEYRLFKSPVYGGVEQSATYHQWVEDGDMVICWKNAPLVSQCFRFIAEGRKAHIQGRDIGKGLKTLVEKQAAADVPGLIKRMEEWYSNETAKEQARAEPSETRLQSIADRFACVLCFTREAETVPAVLAKIDAVFTNNPGEGVRLSSIHKAKGLEAKRVHLLQPEDCRLPAEWCPPGWKRDQQRNLLYVAKTRAIEELVCVS